MMLNFFGMKLQDISTGKVVRHSDYKDRYANLNYNTQNHHRICTRNIIIFTSWKLISSFSPNIDIAWRIGIREIQETFR